MNRYKVIKYWKSIQYVYANSEDEAESVADEVLRPSGELECTSGDVEVDTEPLTKVR